MNEAKKKMNEIILETSKMKLGEAVNFFVAQVYEIIDAELMSENYALMYTIIIKDFIKIINENLKDEIRILKKLIEVLSHYVKKPPIHFNICQN